MKLVLIYSSIICCLLCACNAVQRIEMVNSSGADAEFTWILKQDSMVHSKLFISSNDTVRFVVPAAKPHNKVKLSTGAGSWTPAALAQFANDLESMQWKWKGGVLKLDSLNELIDFLSRRRKGLDKSRIYLEVK